MKKNTVPAPVAQQDSYYERLLKKRKDEKEGRTTQDPDVRSGESVKSLSKRKKNTPNEDRATGNAYIIVLSLFVFLLRSTVCFDAENSGGQTDFQILSTPVLVNSDIFEESLDVKLQNNTGKWYLLWLNVVLKGLAFIHCSALIIPSYGNARRGLESVPILHWWSWCYTAMWGNATAWRSCDRVSGTPSVGNKILSGYDRGCRK